MKKRINKMKHHIGMTEEIKKRFDKIKLKIQLELGEQISQERTLNFLMDNYETKTMEEEKER